MIQPFSRIEGMSSMKYSAWFVGSDNKELVDKKRYEVFVELDPWDKLISCSCECQRFRFRKECKHVGELLQTLKDWGEINEIPKVDKNENIEKI